MRKYPGRRSLHRPESGKRAAEQSDCAGLRHIAIETGSAEEITRLRDTIIENGGGNLVLFSVVPERLYRESTHNVCFYDPAESLPLNPTTKPNPFTLSLSKGVFPARFCAVFSQNTLRVSFHHVKEEK